MDKKLKPVGNMSEADVEDFMKTVNQTGKENSQEQFDTRYQYSYVPMSEVAKKIDEYIIPELQKPCEQLWAKNIFTFMVSNREDFGDTYIILSTLSEENKQIFEKLSEKFPTNYSYNSYRKAPQIRARDRDNVQAMKKIFLELIKPFKMQDVQKDGYMTTEEFLLNDCGCYKEVKNPNYKPISAKMPTIKKGETPKDFFKRLDEWSDNINQSKNIKIFDFSKVEKPIVEYVKDHKKENLFDENLGRIYFDDFYMKHHNEYLKYQKQATF